MNLLTIINTLRIGSSLPNPTPFKWAGLAAGVSLLGLQVIQSFGYLTGVSADDWLQLVMLVMVLLSQVITTDKIGVLPAARSSDPVVQRKPLPADPTESSGFPNGPFFDNDH